MKIAVIRQVREKEYTDNRIRPLWEKVDVVILPLLHRSSIQRTAIIHSGQLASCSGRGTMVWYEGIYLYY